MPVQSPSVKPIFVTTQNAAALLSISRQMVAKLIKQERLPAAYIGTCLRVRVSDLERVIEAYTPERPRGVRVARKNGSQKRRAN